MLFQEIQRVVSIAVRNLVRAVDVLVRAALDTKAVFVKDREMKVVSPFWSVQKTGGVASVAFKPDNIASLYRLTGCDSH